MLFYSFIKGSGALTFWDRNAILNEHNKARQLISLNQVPGLPAATNMREMQWDVELEKIAQLWADQCVAYHDISRNVNR